LASLTRRCDVEIFREDGFAEGRWAKGLCHELAHLPLIGGWHPKVRVWRGTWQQWIQFELDGFSVPFFWSGKPAILSSPSHLFAGYYVERGLPERPDQPLMVMNLGWDWHGFYRAFPEGPMMDRITATVAKLPKERCRVWVTNPPSGDRSRIFSLEGHEDAETIKAHIDSIPPTEWVDVVVGVQYGLEECLNLQDRIVEEIIAPLRIGFEIYNLVAASR
jgi:hypothetical protein